VYGIDVPRVKSTWQTDSEGFRNPSNITVADIAVIGSSFGEYGTEFENTFPGQLEIKLGGPRVVNLSKGGYGPFQYLEVFRRYAVAKQVRYALIVFYAPNDTEHQLGHWIRTGESYLTETSVQSPGVFNGYRTVLLQTSTKLSKRAWTVFESAF